MAVASAVTVVAGDKVVEVFPGPGGSGTLL